MTGRRYEEAGEQYRHALALVAHVVLDQIPHVADLVERLHREVLDPKILAGGFLSSLLVEALAF